MEGEGRLEPRSRHVFISRCVSKGVWRGAPCVSFDPRDREIMSHLGSLEDFTNSLCERLVAPRFNGVVGEQADAVFTASDDVDILLTFGCRRDKNESRIQGNA